MQQTSVILLGVLLHLPISGEPKYKLSKHRTQARSFPGVFWDSFTNHNTGNYLRHGINKNNNFIDFIFDMKISVPKQWQMKKVKKM